MKRFTHGNFTEAFIASVGSMTGIVKDTLELTEICRWYSLKITLISSIFICGYFSFYTFYYLKSITFKNVYLFWHLAKSKLSLWVSLEKKKKDSAWRPGAKTETPEPKPLHWLCACPFSPDSWMSLPQQCKHC